MNTKILIYLLALTIIGCNSLESVDNSSTNDIEEDQKGNDNIEKTPATVVPPTNNPPIAPPRHKSLCGTNEFKEIDTFLVNEEISGFAEPIHTSINTMTSSKTSLVLAGNFIYTDLKQYYKKGANFGSFLRRIANDGTASLIDPSDETLDYTNGGTLRPGLTHLENSTFLYATTPYNKTTNKYELAVSISSDDGKSFKNVFHYGPSGQYQYVSEVALASEGSKVIVAAKTFSSWTYDTSEILLFISNDYGQTFDKPFLVHSTTYPEYMYLSGVKSDDNQIFIIYSIQKTVAGEYSSQEFTASTPDNGQTLSITPTAYLYRSYLLNRKHYSSELNLYLELSTIHKSVQDWLGTTTLYYSTDNYDFKPFEQNLNENLAGRSNSGYHKIFSRGEEIYLVGSFSEGGINHARLACTLLKK